MDGAARSSSTVSLSRAWSSPWRLSIRGPTAGIEGSDAVAVRGEGRPPAVHERLDVGRAPDRPVVVPRRAGHDRFIGGGQTERGDVVLPVGGARELMPPLLGAIGGVADGQIVGLAGEECRPPSPRRGHGASRVGCNGDHAKVLSDDSVIGTDHTNPPVASYWKRTSPPGTATNHPAR